MTWMNLEGIMLSEIRQKTISTLWSHIYVESKKFKLRETEQIGDCHEWNGDVGMGEGSQKYKLPVIRWIHPGGAMDSVLTVANNTVLSIWKLLRE